MRTLLVRPGTTAVTAMILCHEHRFIFFKTNKTAGNSIEIALSKYCGPRDIITPFSPEAEAARHKRGYRGPQNCYASPFDYGAGDIKRLIRRRKRKLKFYNHIGTEEVRDLVGPAIFNSYYKFCVERNPWDRCISMYFWRHREEPRPDFSDFLESGFVRALKNRGFNLYTIGGEVVVDRICQYADLDAELEVARRDIGLPDPLTLGSANTKHRRDRRSHRDFLSDKQAARIAELFADEIALFGYEY